MASTGSLRSRWFGKRPADGPAIERTAEPDQPNDDTVEPVKLRSGEGTTPLLAGKSDKQLLAMRKVTVEEMVRCVERSCGLKLRRALAQIEAGNLSNVKSVGGGVLKYRIDFGPSYRVYFGCDGNRLVSLLIGGTKRRQQRAIDRAADFWADYKRRKER